MAYETVNSQWPEGTNDGRDIKPTPQEAISACRRLYRFAMKRSFSGKIIATSGNRRGGFFMREDRRGRRMIQTIEVNPDRWGGGWHEVVHMMSHRCAFRLFRGSRAHDPRHAFLEREMIKHVIANGFLDGKLKRQDKAKPPVDLKQVRAKRVAQRIAKWQAKKKRAETALRKLERQRRYYERQAAEAA